MFFSWKLALLDQLTYSQCKKLTKLTPSITFLHTFRFQHARAGLPNSFPPYYHAHAPVAAIGVGDIGL